MPDKKDDDSEKDSSEKDKWTYQGDEEEWETFDRRIKRYCEKKYDLLGEALWYGTLPIVESLDPYSLYQYSCDVWKSIEAKSPARAKVLWSNDSGFFERA